MPKPQLFPGEQGGEGALGFELATVILWVLHQTSKADGWDTNSKSTLFLNGPLGSSALP